MAQGTVQREQSFEVMADETIKTGAASNSAQVGVDRQAFNNITAQLLQGGVAALNQLMASNVRLLDLAGQKALVNWDNSAVVSNANAGATADSLVDSRPPDEGQRPVE